MQQLLQDVIALVAQAGQMIRDEFYRPGGPRGGGDKADIDVEVENFLRAALQQRLPGSAVLAEERGHSGDESAEHTWLVDPHDGTSAFLRGFRGSSVSVALLQDNLPVLGVVYAPLYPNDDGDLIAGGPGLGLTRNGQPWNSPWDDAPLGPQDRVAISQDADHRSSANIAALAPARYLAMPSIAYRLALAATGDARVGGSLVYLAEHDIGAGHALLLGAGKVLKPWVQNDDSAITYSPRVRSVPMLGGDESAVDELRSRPAHEILKAPRTSALSPQPDRRSWREKGLSLSRAQGSLLGQLAGDALGSLVEFRSASIIAGLYPDGGPDSLHDGGTWDTLAGQPTDDSEMALKLARQLIRDGGYLPECVFKAYQNWGNSGPFDIGGTTRRALNGQLDPGSQANGSLMRCSPLGLAFSPELLATIAPNDSALTHPHPLCGECCRLFTQTISRGIAGMSVEQAVAAALEDSEGEVHELLQQSLEGPPAEYQAQMGWVKIAFRNAFYLLHQQRPLAEALTWTVRQGGDTDTNAAIAGALLGAFQGEQAVPASWRLAIVSCRPDQANRQSRRPRPRDYWPVDALNLAELLLNLRARDQGSI